MAHVLLCGAATADITPYDFVPGIPLAGFESNRKSREILDPLEAGAVHLADGDRHVTLVTLDLIGFAHPLVELVRDRLTGLVPEPRNTLVCSTHTHSGPDTMGLWGPSFFGVLPRKSGVDWRYMEQLLAAIVRAARDAAAGAVPVSVRPARFGVPPDWFRNDRKGGGKDDFGTAVAFEAADGTRVATLVNFAAHPETLWEGNPLVSPDYPGALRRRLRETAKGVPLFFSGALGGMVTPAVDRKATLKQRRAEKDRLGAGLADLASAALERANAIPDSTLALRRLPLSLPLDNRLFRLLRRLGVIDREFIMGRVRSEMNLVTLGTDVSILTAPGECTPEVGRELVARCPGEHRLLLCLGCDELGYVMTPDQWANSEYRYERTMSVGPRTAAALWEGAEALGRSEVRGPRSEVRGQKPWGLDFRPQTSDF
jgi:hypothetical protein